VRKAEKKKGTVLGNMSAQESADRLSGEGILKRKKNSRGHGGGKKHWGSTSQSLGTNLNGNSSTPAKWGCPDKVGGGKGLMNWTMLKERARNLKKKSTEMAKWGLRQETQHHPEVDHTGKKEATSTRQASAMQRKGQKETTGEGRSTKGWAPRKSMLQLGRYAPEKKGSH